LLLKIFLDLSVSLVLQLVFCVVVEDGIGLLVGVPILDESASVGIHHGLHTRTSSSTTMAANRNTTRVTFSTGVRFICFS